VGLFLIVKHEANISMNPKQSTPKKFLNIFGKYSVFAAHVVERKNSWGISKNEMFVGASISFFEMSLIIFFFSLVTHLANAQH